MKAAEWVKRMTNEGRQHIDSYSQDGSDALLKATCWGLLGIGAIVKCIMSTGVYGYYSGAHLELKNVIDSAKENVDPE